MLTTSPISIASKAKARRLPARVPKAAVTDAEVIVIAGGVREEEAVEDAAQAAGADITAVAVGADDGSRWLVASRSSLAKIKGRRDAAPFVLRILCVLRI
jgi:hypothetical protein